VTVILVLDMTLMAFHKHDSGLGKCCKVTMYECHMRHYGSTESRMGK
jgi:hypothetical protein